MQQKTKVPKAKKPSQCKRFCIVYYCETEFWSGGSKPKKYADGTPKVRRWYAEKVRRKDEEVRAETPVVCIGRSLAATQHRVLHFSVSSL